MSTQPESATAAPAESGKPISLRKNRMWLYTLAYVVGGAVVGFGYHKLVGCRTGACPITANPYISTLYGALMGFLAGGMLER
jgi:hypothetical protein